MKHRGAGITYLVSIVFCFVAAFFTMSTLDEFDPVGENYYLVRVADQAPDPSLSDNSSQLIEEFAHQNAVNVGRVEGAGEDPESNRILYLAVGDENAPTTHWINNGYPKFNRHTHTAVIPYSALDKADLRGTYFVYGSQANADRLVERLGGAGYSAKTTGELLEPAGLVAYLGEGPLGLSAATVGLVVCIVTGSSVVANTRAYGIRRMQGRSPFGILFEDFRSLAKTYLSTLLGISVAASIALFIYNRLNQFDLYLLFAAALLVFFAAVSVVSHILALTIVFRTTIAGAVKGELASSWSLIAAYIVRIPATLLVILVMLSTTTSMTKQANQQEALRQRLADDETFQVSISGISGADDQMRTVVAPWLREQERGGNLLLAANSRNSLASAPNISSRSQSVPPTLYINNQFLETEKIIDVEGEAVQQAQPGDPVRLLIPASLEPKQNTILERAEGAVNLGGEPPEDLQIILTEDGQELRSHNSPFEEQTEATTVNPIVVAYPPEFPLSDLLMVQNLTQGGAVFLSTEPIEQAIDDPAIGKYIFGYISTKQAASNQLRRLSSEARLSIANLGIVLALLPFTTLVAISIYARGRSKHIFVKYLHGWPNLNIHTFVLCVELAFMAGLLWWGLTNSLTDLPDHQQSAAEQTAQSWRPGIVFLVAFAGIGVAWAALTRYTKRVVRTNSAAV